MNHGVSSGHIIVTINNKLKLTSNFQRSSIIEQFFFVVVTTFCSLLPGLIGITSMNFNELFGFRLHVTALYVI